ncbi:MAG: type I-C CRISPR-associated protein Cas5 [Dehalococcoidales bacterium]|nr:type I-C CRISPR-associated protein Cas5 [Dehalococcoidales bacterium]
MNNLQSTSGPIRLRVWGRNACFTRPEMKVERVSYDVITPSAARGILEAIHWKPAICWHIDRIDVLNPIRWESVRRNEIGSTMSPRTEGLYIEDNRQQRAGLLLRDVDYVIHAHFTLTDKAGDEDSVIKHREIFLRRVEKGQHFHHPYLGCREFPAYVSLIPLNSPLPEPQQHLSELGFGAPRDLGYMLFDIQHDESCTKDNQHSCGETCIPQFFRAIIHNGQIVPTVEEVHS